MQLMMIGVKSKDAGLSALDRLADAVAEGTISVDDAALVYRNDTGKVKIHQTHDVSAKGGAMRGGAVGLLVGLVAAPAVVAATAVGAGAGALIAKARDSGLSEKLMKQMGDLIEGAEAAVFVLADDSSTLMIGSLLEELIAEGYDVNYAIVPAEAQDFLRETLKLAASAS
ncbi:MAG: DUF1269 domain-containing protein [Thermoleophilia bacterium]|jgi:uncharacterized membrane protein